MDIVASINEAKTRAQPISKSQIEWDSMRPEEQEAARRALNAGEIGSGKMQTVLREHGVNVSKYFLETKIVGSN